MSDDQAHKAETQAWLTKAQLDFAAATKLSEAASPFSGIAAYLYQQAAEKALKSLLVWYNAPFSKTHDLSVLLAQSKTFIADMNALQREAEILTPLATQYRYPGDDTNIEPTPDELQAALHASRLIVHFVENHLAAIFDRTSKPSQ